MATAVSGYQSNALAAKVALYTNQGTGNSSAGSASGAAGGSDAKSGSGDSTPVADGKNGGTPGDSVILTLSAAAQQWLASQQAGAQTQSQSRGYSPAGQPASLAEYLSASDASQPGQNGFIDTYSGAIKRFQQWLSQPSQVTAKPPADHFKLSADKAGEHKAGEAKTTSQADAAQPDVAKTDATVTTQGAAETPGAPAAKA